MALLHVSRLPDAAPAAGQVLWVPPAESPCESQHMGLAQEQMRSVTHVFAFVFLFCFGFVFNPMEEAVLVF